MRLFTSQTTFQQIKTIYDTETSLREKNKIPLSYIFFICWYICCLGSQKTLFQSSPNFHNVLGKFLRFFIDMGFWFFFRVGRFPYRKFFLFLSMLFRKLKGVFSDQSELPQCIRAILAIFYRYGFLVFFA